MGQHVRRRAADAPAPSPAGPGSAGLGRREVLVAGSIGLGTAAWVAATGPGALAGANARQHRDNGSTDCSSPSTKDNADNADHADNADNADNAGADATDRATPTLNTDAIQGNILGGFNKDHQH